MTELNLVRRLRHTSGGRNYAVDPTRADLWGLADQALISGTNFVLFVLVGRAVGRVEFGAFALTYTAFLLAYGVQSALITQAHNVLGTARTRVDYRRYTGSTASLQLAVSVVFAAACVAAAVVVWAVGAPWYTMLLAAAPAIGAWQAQEFFRKVCYTEGRHRAAFVIDLVGYGGQALALAILWRAEELTGTTALATIAACSALAALYGAARVRASLGPLRTSSAWRANWRFGRWLVAAWLGGWVSTQMAVYLAVAFVGTDAAGVLKAAQIVLAPLNVLFLFLYTVLPIRLAPLALTDRGALALAVRRAFLLTAPIVVTYLSVVTLAAGPALTLLYGTKYGGEEAVVALLALFYAATYVATILIAALTATQRTRSVFVANAAGSVAATSSGLILTWAFGLTGAVVAMIVAELSIVAVLGVAYRRMPRGDHPSEGTTGPPARYVGELR